MPISNAGSSWALVFDRRRDDDGAAESSSFSCNSARGTRRYWLSPSIGETPVAFSVEAEAFRGFLLGGDLG